MAKRKASPEPEPVALQEYTVLARRYRPQQFAEVIGQEAVARALVNALESNRVAHAYLFTGARGVGKTSTARILAKALNCVKGPTATPCDQCSACKAISTGEDVDVLEIDAASNRGIDEVREIRQNVQYRPGRSRYKIYIIDEVHMLTAPAFNALLKTLEEPPAHVKFILATTEVQKIPVTILSRCQRFDFSGISTPRIVEQLRKVVADEGMKAEDEALELVARRAGGSMRDAQSLLDQLLAFSTEGKDGKLTAEQVHRLLGMAHDERVAGIAAAVLEGDAKKVLELLDQAEAEGLQFGEFLDQLMDYWRDLMVVHCAGIEGRDLTVSPRYKEALARQTKGLSLDAILAGLDVLSSTKSRLRGTGHGRILLEMALIRLSRLNDLVSLSQLSQWLGGAGKPKAESPAGPATATPAGPRVLSSPSRAATPAAEPEKKNPAAGAETEPSRLLNKLTNENIGLFWPEVLRLVGPMLAGNLEKVSALAISGPNTLVLQFPARYNFQRDVCQEPTRLARVEEALTKLTGQTWNLRVESALEGAAQPEAPAAEAERSLSRYHRQRAGAMQEPLVKRAAELMGAQIVQVDDGFGGVPSETAERPETTDDAEA